MDLSFVVFDLFITFNSLIYLLTSAFFNGLYSEFVKIFDSRGVEVYSRRGCNSVTSGLTVEIPFSGGSSITLAASISYRYSYVRAQYTILKQALSLGKISRCQKYSSLE